MDPRMSFRNLGLSDSEIAGLSLSGLDFGDYDDGWRTSDFDDVDGDYGFSDMDGVDAAALIISELEFGNDDDDLEVEDFEFADDDDGLSISEIAFALNYDDVSGGASDIMIEKLKTERSFVGHCLMGKIQESEKCCSICLEELSGMDILIDLPCTHVFHESCVLQWLQMQNSCPLCRRQPYEDAVG